MSQITRPMIRVESDGVGHATHVYYLPPNDAKPVDISRCVQGVDLHIDVKTLNTATLQVIGAGGRIDAELEDLIVKTLKPRRRFLRRRVEISHVGYQWRKWLRS